MYISYSIGPKKKMLDFPVDEVTVSVDEETGKSLFLDRDN